jgi:hypothetical protein
MAQFGVSIGKQAPWRGLQVEFSNRYHFVGDVNILTETQMVQIIEAVMSAERPVHTAEVSFISGKLWGPTGTGQANSVMRASKLWTGINGTAAAATQPIYRECA